MKVGFIGVGNMGGPMCRNIIKRSNHQVTVFDLNPAAVKTCTDLGGTAAKLRANEARGRLTEHKRIDHSHLQADGQQDGRLDRSPAGQVRLPASRITVAIARKISWREILDSPRVRSVKVIGSSTMVSPPRSQRVRSSTSAEYPDDRSGRVTRKFSARIL